MCTTAAARLSWIREQKNEIIGIEIKKYGWLETSIKRLGQEKSWLN